jgi:hypothetical protein
VSDYDYASEPRMTEEEHEIWAATYAAYFVAEFRSVRAASVSKPFDDAARVTTAEAAITVADLAVTRLREWRRDERSSAGRLIRK